MRKKIALLVLGLLLVSGFLINLYSQMTYNSNIYDLIFANHQLSNEDREYLKAHGPLIYGSDDNSPPLRFYDGETREYRGLAIDYLRALAIELETEIQFKPMIWDDALNALAAGTTDLCDMYPSKERASKYLFSNPVYYQRGILVVPSYNSNIMSVNFLVGKRVALQRGDYVHEYLLNSGPQLEFVFTRDYEESIALLLTGKVDAVAGDEPVISYFLDKLQLGEKLTIVDQPLYQMPMVLSTHIDDKELQSILNKGIYALTQKNIITKIQQKWFGISTPIGADLQGQRIRLLFLAFTLGASFVVATIIIWNFELKKAVRLRTQALEISRNNLQTIIDGLDHMIVVVTDDWMILSANRHFYGGLAHKFGDEIAPTKGPSLEGDSLEKVPSSLAELIPNWLDWTKQEWATWPMEMHPGERVIFGRTYRISPYPIKYNADQTPSCLIVFEDVTDQRLTVAKMLQENKMSAIGQLATGIAHEIRNPLGLIRNYAFLIKRKPQDQELLVEAIPIIEESVDKASSIIDNLLNFSRLTNDVRTQFSVDTVIQNVVRLNDKLMHRSHIRLKLVLEPVTATWCEASLRHILMNIMNNAIDAIPKKGQLTIWLKPQNSGDEVAIHIIDTGEGMSEETLQRLFDPFFTTKQVGLGTGLGLYIVYNELTKHGGRITALSKPGKGTIFKLTLTPQNPSDGVQYES